MALKILLVGFSSPSAGALTVLLQRNYPQTECLILDRCFSDDLRLMLPKLGRNTADAYGVIINLEGVGMPNFNTNHIKSLIDFIDFRAVLLLARNDIHRWRQADFLPRTSGLFLEAPYNKEIMERALVDFIQMATSLQANPSEAVKNRAKIHIHAAKYLEENSKEEALESNNNQAEIPPKTTINSEDQPKDDFLQTVVTTCFSGVCQNNVMYDLIDIFSNRQPFKVTAGTQTVYIHPNKAIALATNLERLLDYFSVAGNCQVLKTNIATQPIDDNEFNRAIDNLRNEGYKRYPLNTFLWQIYSVILPSRINVPKNNLKLKMKYMPNFGSMQNVPEYVHAITSSCLITPKNTDELNEIFGESIKSNPTVLQRILLLSILSDLADPNVLKQSFYESDENKDLAKTSEKDEEMPFAQTEIVTEITPNKGVAQATKTGFFKRLLSKLSF